MVVSNKLKARATFKLLKAGLKSPEELTKEEKDLLRVYYPFMF